MKFIGTKLIKNNLTEIPFEAKSLTEAFKVQEKESYYVVMEEEKYKDFIKKVVESFPQPK